MPSYIDFFAGFAATGRVLDVGVGSVPDDWSTALGADFTDESGSAHHLVRQFGLVDAHFDDSSGGWTCNLVNLRPGQLYRFDDWVPQPIVARFGAFPGRIPFEELVDPVSGAGLEIHHITRTHPATLEEYWIPESKVRFSLISEYQVDDFPALRVGDVWSVGIDARIDIPADQRTRYR
ncbi:hypothetical protein [Krasilnikovia sp. MM14-A1004]|uniref:hypothetical protein n=1 Tax=Krasilnikovia sp. MM14-A1004 TaxID=3373541 RepID=UPI00399C84ED